MSRLEVNIESREVRVTLPTAKKLPPNPHFGWQHQAIIQRALNPPSETQNTHSDSEFTPESREEKSLRQRLLVSDQRSFLTGSATADLQAAHVLNTVRKNPKRKRRLQDFLTKMRFHSPIYAEFIFDRADNAILLEAGIHVQWDLYGAFCIVPSENDAVLMIEELRKLNKQWAKSYDFFLKLARPLDVSQEPFVNPSWDVVVLHPLAMIPKYQTLGIARDRFLYPRDGSPPPSQQTWTWCTAINNRLCLNGNENTPLPPFAAVDRRFEFSFPPVSSLAMAVNAHSKLQAFIDGLGGMSEPPPRVQRFFNLMNDLVEEIFFLPAEFDIESLTQEDDEHAQGVIGTNQFQTFGAAGQFSGATNMETTSGPANTFNYTVRQHQASTPADGMAVEYPEVPDTDGLTDTEFKIVSDQASDPQLTRKQRANAAMLMIFGTHQYKKPYMHGPQVVDG